MLMGKTKVDGTADMWEVDYRQMEKMTADRTTDM